MVVMNLCHTDQDSTHDTKLTFFHIRLTGGLTTPQTSTDLSLEEEVVLNTGQMKVVVLLLRRLSGEVKMSLPRRRDRLNTRTSKTVVAVITFNETAYVGDVPSVVPLLQSPCESSLVPVTGLSVDSEDLLLTRYHNFWYGSVLYSFPTFRFL